MEGTQGYHFFWSGHFSQWHRSDLTYEGVNFQCAEQAMMHAKAMLFGDQTIAGQILDATDPGKQKALGRQVKGFDDTVWDTAKETIVHDISLAKYVQNKGLRRKLFQTHPALMVEASPMDTVWGIGLDEAEARETPPELWPGQNLLGKILTRVRVALADMHSEEFSAIAPK